MGFDSCCGKRDRHKDKDKDRETDRGKEIRTDPESGARTNLKTNSNIRKKYKEWRTQKEGERQGRIWAWGRNWKHTRAGMKEKDKLGRRDKMKDRVQERVQGWFGDWDMDKEGTEQTHRRVKGTDSGREIRTDPEEDGETGGRDEGRKWERDSTGDRRTERVKQLFCFNNNTIKAVTMTERETGRTMPSG